MHSTDHAEIKLPPPFVLLIHILAGLLLQWLIPLPATMPAILRWVGVLVTSAGLLLGGLGMRQMLSHHTPVDPRSSSKVLVTDFPYSFTRNPIYMGFGLMLAGVLLAFGSYWGILLLIPFVLLMNWLVIRHEEAYLGEKFGEAYAVFKSRVRRWL